MSEQTGAGIRIAIVGAGPRGISALERISANHRLSENTPIAVTIFDPFEPGGGRIWSGDQPQHLLMNTLCADATHFVDASVLCEGPIVKGPNLFEWAQLVANAEIKTAEPSIVAEARTLEPHSHPSRKILGRYLEWCYSSDLERLPADFSVDFIKAEVIGIEHVGATTILETAEESYEFDSVIIASGHSDLVPNPSEAANVDFAQRNGLFYGLPSNPIDQDLEGILPGQKIAVRGLGMNFFDYMSLLTEGRGGKFKENEDGTLLYLPSGLEPTLIAGSRRGVPYRSKGVFGAMTPQFEPRYLVAQVVNSLENEQRQLDFQTDIWPLAARDAAYTYYRILSKNNPELFAGDFQEIAAALDNNDWDSPAVQHAVAAVIPRPHHRIDFNLLDRPLAGITFMTYESFVDWWYRDLIDDYSQAKEGIQSAAKCAAVVIGATRTPIRRLARYGGFTGASYARDIQGWIRGFGGSLASGPPARRINELAALVKAGIVLPLGPDMAVKNADGAFWASSPAIPDTIHRCNGLLEAHLPGNQANRSVSPLLRQILDKGLGRLYQIPTPGEEPFLTGALEVGPEPYELVSAEGVVHRGIFVLGVPLESIHWGTQLGPIANTNSRFLRDSDAVARASIIYGRKHNDQLESAQHA